MAMRPSEPAAGERILNPDMKNGTGPEPCGQPEASRAVAEFVRVLEAIEGVRLDTWENVGLTLQQCRVLHVIEDLARRLGVRPATVTLQLNRLMRLGLVERIRDRTDRRVRHVVLTECGRQVLGSMLHPPPGTVARALAQYHRDEVEALCTMLDQLNAWITRQAESSVPSQLPAAASA
jgi:DNA-binding MarR family transcriptional regulator